MYYASKVLTGAAANYTTTEKEMLAIFDIKIRDKKGAKNLVADHLSRLELGELDREEDNLPMTDSLVGEQLMRVDVDHIPWYAHFVNHLACRIIPPDLSHNQKRKFLSDVKRYFWDDPFLYRLCADGLYRTCVDEDQIKWILECCH
ncbi:unnamed protein product [Rhodiola kirilowii]